LCLPKRTPERFQKNKFAIVFSNSQSLTEALEELASNEPKCRAIRTKRFDVFGNVAIAYLDMNQKINTFARVVEREIRPKALAIFCCSTNQVHINHAVSSNRPVHFKINWDLILGPPNNSADKYNQSFVHFSNEHERQSKPK
jgi:hypothetical protein